MNDVSYWVGELQSWQHRRREAERMLELNRLYPNDGYLFSTEGSEDTIRRANEAIKICLSQITNRLGRRVDDEH